jgi:hypothetical protein
MMRPNPLPPVTTILGCYLEEPRESYYGYPHVVVVHDQEELTRLTRVGHNYLPFEKEFRIVQAIPGSFWLSHRDLYRDYPHERVEREMTISVAEYGVSLEKRQYVIDTGNYYPGENPETWEDAQRVETLRIAAHPQGQATQEDRESVQRAKDRLLRSRRKLKRPSRPISSINISAPQPPLLSSATLEETATPRRSTHVSPVKGTEDKDDSSPRRLSCEVAGRLLFRVLCYVNNPLRNRSYSTVGAPCEASRTGENPH